MKWYVLNMFWRLITSMMSVFILTKYGTDVGEWLIWAVVGLGILWIFEPIFEAKEEVDKNAVVQSKEKL